MVREQKDGQLYFDFDNNPIDFEREALRVNTKYLLIREKMNMTNWSVSELTELARKADVLLDVRENLYRMVL